MVKSVITLCLNRTTFSKNIFRFSSGETFVLLEQVKSSKDEFNKKMYEFVWVTKREIFHWQCKYIYGKLYFVILQYLALFKVGYIFWVHDW